MFVFGIPVFLFACLRCFCCEFAALVCVMVLDYVCFALYCGVYSGLWGVLICDFGC